jgi:hypothetical protein
VRLAMFELGYFILGRGNLALRISGQQILRTLAVREAVEPREPECQSPSVLRVSEMLRISAISLRGRWSPGLRPKSGR